MKIKNINNLSVEQMNHELANGAKFVVFPYCISIWIMTFRESSSIYFIKSGESTIKYSIPYTLISLFAGWWGVPWGPIYTFGSIRSNLSGGKNVTDDVLKVLNSE